MFSAYDNVVSVILMGSTSRGELSYIKIDGELTIFSDYEFLLITKRKFIKTELSALKNKIHLLEQRFCSNNPLFHIDFSYTTVKRISKFPKILRQYEFTKTARVICGDDLILRFPEVTLKNLDFKNLNEIIFKRLWHILKFIPNRFLHGDLTDQEKIQFNYVLSRNVLDISTIYLPYHKVLLPTYTERVNYIRNNNKILNASEDFDYNFPEFLQNALKGKIEVNFKLPIYEMYEQTIRYYSNLLMFIKNRAGYTFSRKADVDNDYGQLFNEWPVDRHESISLIVLLIKIVRNKKINVASKWLFLKKKAMMTSLLFDIHQSLQFFINGDPRYENYLESSKFKLDLLSIVECQQQPDFIFPQYWLWLRENFSDFWLTYSLSK